MAATVNAITASKNVGLYCAEKDCRVPAHAHVVCLKYCEVCGQPFTRRLESRQRDCWPCIELTMMFGWPHEEISIQ